MRADIIAIAFGLVIAAVATLPALLAASNADALAACMVKDHSREECLYALR